MQRLWVALRQTDPQEQRDQQERQRRYFKSTTKGEHALEHRLEWLHFDARPASFVLSDALRALSFCCFCLPFSDTHLTAFSVLKKRHVMEFDKTAMAKTCKALLDATKITRIGAIINDKGGVQSGIAATELARASRKGGRFPRLFGCCLSSSLSHRTDRCSTHTTCCM